MLGPGYRLHQLSLSEYLDCVWVTLLDQRSGMGSAHEHREVMKAALGYDERTVEQVLAEQEARSKEAAKSGGRSKSKAAPSHGTIRPSEMAKLRALMNPSSGPSAE